MNVAVMGGILGFIGGILWAVALLIRRKVKQVPSIRPEPALAGGIMSLNENNKHNAEMRAREAELIPSVPMKMRHFPAGSLASRA